MDIKKELGEKIKRLRNKKGLTQVQLAEKIDISSRNLSKIELGLSFVKAETLERILESLDVTTEEMFANDHIKSSEELRDGIEQYLNKLKNNNLVLEKIYKIIKLLADDI